MPQGNLRDLIISNQELYELTGKSDLKQLSDVEKISKLTDKEIEEYDHRTYDNRARRWAWYKYFSEPTNSDRAVILRPSFIQDKNKIIEHFIKKFKIKSDSPSVFLAFLGGLGTVFVTTIIMEILNAIGSITFEFKHYVYDDFIWLLALLGGGVIFAWDTCEVLFFNKRRIMKELKKSMPTRLGIFLDEVDKYNSIVQELINQIDAMDRLAAIGHPVTFNNREEIIASFQTMRSDLVRALQTERILREHNIRPEEFSLEFVPIKSLEFQGEVQQIAKLVNDAAEIGLTVQEEMRKLCVPENNKELQEISK